MKYTHPIASAGCSGGCGGASNVFTDHPISMERDGQKYYYLYDGQGSVTELVDSSGNVVNQYRYTPFGESRVKIETVENPYEYAGRRLDDESGKYYNRARIYSAEQGRFMSQDVSEFHRNSKYRWVQQQVRTDTRTVITTRSTIVTRAG